MKKFLFCTALFLVASVWSVWVRIELPWFDMSQQQAKPVLREDPAAGAGTFTPVLIDLEDDADADDFGRVAKILKKAIAPLPWTATGKAALGTVVSEKAQLYRLASPASEVGDVLTMLADQDGVEVVERERTWSLPANFSPANFNAARLSEAEPSRTKRAETNKKGPYKPNDPYYKFQWHMQQIGMPAAWSQNRGEGAVVAVIDTGVLYRSGEGFVQAPDLGETTFVSGYDFVSGDAYPDDEHGHGTHVAGTVAQSTHNGIGVTGVAPDARIMPIRVLDRNGTGRWGDIVAGIRFAADNGAHVINMSLGGGMPSKTVQKAITYAHNRGVTVVAAAGNASREHVEYPSGYDHVISVGAVRFDETLSFYSNYGTNLDVVAPGGDLNVDQNGDGKPDGVFQNTMLRGNPSQHDYLAFQGTSMAAPHVAGIAALLYSSGVKDPDAIEDVLKSTAKPPTDPKKYGAGLVQADAALAATRTRGGTRGMLALLLSFAAVGFGRRRRMGVVAPIGSAAWNGSARSSRSVFAGAAAAFVLAGGLALIPWALIGVPVAGWITSLGLGGWLSFLLPSWIAIVVVGALLPLTIAALFLSVRRFGPTALTAVGTATAAFLVLEALHPFVGGWFAHPLAGPWLLLNAAASYWLAGTGTRHLTH